MSTEASTDGFRLTTHRWGGTKRFTRTGSRLSRLARSDRARPVCNQAMASSLHTTKSVSCLQSGSGTVDHLAPETMRMKHLSERWKKKKLAQVVTKALRAPTCPCEAQP
eukprot:scaffold7092_cov262-Pinguiococcus_pyrenoidosus.AAC.3